MHPIRVASARKRCVTSVTLFYLCVTALFLVTVPPFHQAQAATPFCNTFLENRIDASFKLRRLVMEHLQSLKDPKKAAQLLQISQKYFSKITLEVQKAKKQDRATLKNNLTAHNPQSNTHTQSHIQQQHFCKQLFDEAQANGFNLSP